MHIPCEFCKNGPLAECEHVLECRADWDDIPDDCADCVIELEAEDDPVEEVRKEWAEYLASDKFKINVENEN